MIDSCAGMIEVIEHFIEEQDGIWPMSTSLNVYKTDSISVWVKNDGDHINLHHARRLNGLKSEPWHVSEEQVMIMYLRGDNCLGTVWTESWSWKERVIAYLRKFNLVEDV